jgi:DNA-binding winged helix-turn-helix (wHTH) protein
MSTLENPIYQFGDFELDPGERRLSNNGQLIALTPKVFDTLVLLVKNAGHVTRKDTLLTALWPRGFVEESTLSNHIWQIRRALGDTAKSTRFIETVPKLGYRFTAPVTLRAGPSGSAGDPAAKDTASADVEAPVGVVGRPAPYRLIGSVAALVALGLALAWMIHLRFAPAGPAPPDGVRTIALTGFNSLSRVAGDAWLSPALASMLATELGATHALRVVPDTTVHDATSGLTPPVAGGYSGEALTTIRSRMEADYILSGSYLIGAGGDGSPVRVDLTLQDLHSGAVLATVSRQSEMSSLNMLVEQLSGALGARLGLQPPTPAALGVVAKLQLPTPEVARHVGVALDAMQRYDLARARDELLEAIAQAPGFAPSYLYLAEAYTGLGLRLKARAAAERAAALAVDLPPDLKLQVNATEHATRYEWKEAAASLTSLVALQPQQLDHRIALVDALLAAGEPQQAQLACDELRRIPYATLDPRATLAAARAAIGRNDVHGSAALATEALAQARRRELPAIIADAEVQLATSRMRFGEGAEAKADLVAAIEGYRSIGNPHGEAYARRNLARLIDDGREAREEYQRSMALAQRIGDQGTVGAVYKDLAEMLWVAGDRDAAEVAARRGLEVSREIGDLQLEIWTLRAIATVAADDAATDAVLEQYREVTDLTVRSHDAGGHVWSLATNADILRIRGQLSEAQEQCGMALSEAKALSDPQFLIYSEFNCAQVAMDRGEVAAARALLEDTSRDSAKSDSPVYEGNAQMLLGQLALEASRPNEAVGPLQKAIKIFASSEANTGEADAQSLLAICGAALRDAPLRDRARARAAQLRLAITSRLEVYAVDIELAQLAAGRDRPAAIARLRDIAADAERRHWPSWSLEAKLAAWRLMMLDTDADSAAYGRALEDQARQLGFGRVLALVRQPPPVG